MKFYLHLVLEINHVSTGKNVAVRLLRWVFNERKKAKTILIMTKLILTRWQMELFNRGKSIGKVQIIN